jgi:6-phosphogluconolactonase (cycloisomerase 2 family)
MAANNTGSMTNKTHTTYRTVGITQIDVDSKRRSLYVAVYHSEYKNKLN